MMPKLPEKHSIVLKYVADFYKERKYPPIIAEIVRRFGWARSTIEYIVYRLQELGYVDLLRSENGRMRGVFPLWKE